MKYTLGISLGFNASACIMDHHQNVVYAASEERFTNVKNCKFFPLLAIKNGIESMNIDPNDIVNCYYSHYQNPDVYDLYRHTYGIDAKIPARTYKCKEKTFSDATYSEQYHLELSFIRSHLKMLGVDVDNIVRINHHFAHAACSYILSPFHDKDSDTTNLYVVMDGFGDGESISMWTEDRLTGLKRIYSEPMCKSVALVYQFVTGALGYKEHQHEGKLTGLAAFGDSDKYFKEFKDLYKGFESIEHDETINSPIIDFDIFVEMKKRTYKFVNDIIENMSPEEAFEESKHIAASLQAFAESEAFNYVTKVIDEMKFEKVNLMLSGGLFANVKINQRLHEQIEQVENVFIAPPMGDEGTCIGAATGTMLIDRKDYKMTNMTMRMGTAHSEEDIVASSEGLSITRIEGIEEVSKAIAEDLSKNRIVCLFDERMEFGPRALIGRTIMYNCKDKGANDWLNKQLGRTEYMPFAPFCKKEHCDDLFENVKGKEIALKNMTITVNCKDEFIQNYPAACHVDNTARPQVISEDENKLAWAILDEYESITGEKALINTSFNLHNYPIIESPKVAIDSWKTSNTDRLYIGGNGVWYKICK